jgi:hypothetical protein
VWPGGTQTLTPSAGCSVTVSAPTGVIDLVGGTVGVDGWTIVSTTGYLSATGAAQVPTCRSPGAAASVTANNRPTCSNASTVFESGHSTDDFVVTLH